MFNTYILLFVGLACIISNALAQRPPREFAKSKCEQRIKNETLAEKCKICVDQSSLSESPSKSEMRTLLRTCIPKKDPKQWVKGKCEDNSDSQDDVEKCFQCVEEFNLPQNATRKDVREMKKKCLPQQTLKFKSKRKCAKKFQNKEEIEVCQNCIQSYTLTDKPTCEEINEMKRQCITDRSSKELWVAPITEDEEE